MVAELGEDKKNAGAATLTAWVEWAAWKAWIM